MKDSFIEECAFHGRTPEDEKQRIHTILIGLAIDLPVTDEKLCLEYYNELKDVIKSYDLLFDFAFANYEEKPHKESDDYISDEDWRWSTCYTYREPGAYVDYPGIS